LALDYPGERNRRTGLGERRVNGRKFGREGGGTGRGKTQPRRTGGKFCRRTRPIFKAPAFHNDAPTGDFEGVGRDFVSARGSRGENLKDNIFGLPTGGRFWRASRHRLRRKKTDLARFRLALKGRGWRLDPNRGGKKKRCERPNFYLPFRGGGNFRRSIFNRWVCQAGAPFQFTPAPALQRRFREADYPTKEGVGRIFANLLFLKGGTQGEEKRILPTAKGGRSKRGNEGL